MATEIKSIPTLKGKEAKKFIEKAEKMQGVAGENLLQLLERRLDNVIYRLGIAPSRPAARQVVTHGHVMLNGKRVDIPSIIVSPEDEITIRETSLKSTYFVALKDSIDPNQTLPSWLSFDQKKFSAKVTGLPLREEQDQEIEEQLIIEYYSR
jgi:small subunit ribosomal protein S4